MPGAAPGFGFPVSDGERLYAGRVGPTGPVSHLVRLEPRTGAVLAEYRYEPVPPGSPFDSNGVWLSTGSAIVLLEGARSEAVILDPDTLEVRRRVALPANSRSYIPWSGRTDSPVWIGHRRNEGDTLLGVHTFMGATRIDPAAGLGETRETPVCGTRGGAQPTPRLLIIDVNCAEQIAFVDLESGATEIVSAFQRQTDIRQLGTKVWARWRTLGFVGTIDPFAKTIKALDLNAEGPLLASMGGLSQGAGSVWVLGEVADPDIPNVVYRIDPRSVTVSGRASKPGGGVAVLDGVGYGFDADGRLATFDPAGVTGGKPTEVIRPELSVTEPHRPRNAAERMVIANFLRVYDHRVPNPEVAALIEDPDTILPVRTKLIELARTAFPGVEVVVTQVSVRGDRASVVYSFLLDGKPALGTLAGSLRRVDGTWKVSRESICRFAIEAAIDPGC
jgi:hypothetical protein